MVNAKKLPQISAIIQELASESEAEDAWVKENIAESQTIRDMLQAVINDPAESNRVKGMAFLLQLSEARHMENLAAHRLIECSLLHVLTEIKTNLEKE